jgi:hypothetical protein
MDVYEAWGFVLCCGFFFISASEGGQKLVKLWQEKVTKDYDDQRSLNRLLLNSGIVWDDTHAKSENFSFRGKTPRYFDRLISGVGEEFKVGLLPHGSYQRVLDSSIPPIVAHPISEKTALSGEELLKINNYWLLPD